MSVPHNMKDAPEKPASPFLIGSLLFHGLVVGILIVGLPYVTPELPPMEEPVAVEIFDIDEMTQTTAPTKKAEETKKTPVKKAPEKPEDKPKPAAPQVTAKTPPKPMAPKPPEETVAIPDAKKPPEPVKKMSPKPKPPEKPKERMLTASSEEEQEDFQSLLRNLMPAEPEQAASETPDSEGKPQRFTPLGERMTLSEQDALRRQLAACWNLLAGARYAEDLVVEIKLFMNADRTIREARIVNQLRYNQDSFFRAAADSALRALYNPQCNPLDLPPEKYQQWETITVTFDPRSML